MSRVLGWQIAVPRLRVPSLSRGGRSALSATRRASQTRRLPPMLGCASAAAIESPRRPKPQPPSLDAVVGLRPALSPRFWLEPADLAPEGPGSADSMLADGRENPPPAELNVDGGAFHAPPCRRQEGACQVDDVKELPEAARSDCRDSTLGAGQDSSPALDHTVAECSVLSPDSHNDNEVVSEFMGPEGVRSAASMQGSSQCQSTQFFCIADGDDDDAEYDYFPALTALDGDAENVLDQASGLEASFSSESPDANAFGVGDGADAVEWLAKVVLTAIECSPEESTVAKKIAVS